MNVTAHSGTGGRVLSHLQEQPLTRAGCRRALGRTGACGLLGSRTAHRMAVPRALPLGRMRAPHGQDQHEQSSVMAPMIVTTVCAAGAEVEDRRPSGRSGRRPAVTMVAAWMSAPTRGSGPSIASGSQVCSGNCPDLPQAPSSSIRRDGRGHALGEVRRPRTTAKDGAAECRRTSA